MQEHEEKWLELCKKAAVEQDAKKLQELVKEIAWLLELKQQRLRGVGNPVRDFDSARDERDRKVS